MVLALGFLLGRLVLSSALQELALSAVGILTLLLGIGATASRGGAIAAAFACIIAVLFLLYRHGLWRTLRFLLLIGALVAVAYFIFPDYWAVLERRFSGEGTSITGERTELITVALNYFQDNPLFGIGFQSFRSYNPGITLHPPHNTYIGLLAETGLIGLGLFLSMLAVAFHNLWSTIRLAGEDKRLQLDLPVLVGMLLGLTGFSAAIFFGDNAHNKFFWLILALIQMTALAAQQSRARAINGEFSS